MNDTKIEAYAKVEKRVKPSGNTSRILLPKSWNGKRVLVLLLEPLD